MNLFYSFTMTLVDKAICAMNDEQVARLEKITVAKHKINKISRLSNSYAFRLGAIQAVSQSTAKEYKFY